MRFIKLSISLPGQLPAQIFVSAYSISAIRRFDDEGGTTIWTDGGAFVVTETPERILEILSEKVKP